MKFRFLSRRLRRMLRFYAVGDYMWFFTLLAMAIIFVCVWTYRLKTGRNDAAAARRVRRKLRWLAGRKSRVLPAAELKLPGADLVFLTSSGAVAVRTIGWGIRIYGSVNSPEWQAKDTLDERRIPNPLNQLQPAIDEIKSRLTAAGLTGATVRPLTVFADPFEQPTLYLEYGACSITCDGLKEWFRSLPDAQQDPEQLEAALRAEPPQVEA